jgi:hypothetical protein
MKTLTLGLVAVALAACQPGSTSQPVPSVATVGSGIKCAQGDHPFSDSQAGWGFCYPGTWRYIEKSQGSPSPPGLDLTFDITDIPCVTPSAAPGEPSAHPLCSPNAGLFAFMIISTYQRGDATSLAGWIQANLTPPPAPALQSIRWGNSVEAGQFADGRRIAMTAHLVVILDLHSSAGNLDLEGSMSSRLDTWKFSY